MTADAPSRQIKDWLSAGSLLLSLCGILWLASAEVSLNRTQSERIGEHRVRIGSLEEKRQGDREELVALRGAIDDLTRRLEEAGR